MARNLLHFSSRCNLRLDANISRRDELIRIGDRDMKTKCREILKGLCLGLAFLGSAAMLTSCYVDSNDCYEVGYVVCDNGWEFQQTEYCTPYCDYYGRCYESCYYDGQYVPVESCWTEYRCGNAPECWNDSDCRSNICENNVCKHYNIGGNTGGNTGGNASRSCSDDAHCLSSEICAVYGNGVGECRSRCYADNQCPSGQYCEFLGNSVSLGACLDNTYGCDCGDTGLQCYNGRCAVSCYNDAYACTDGATSFDCVRGICDIR